MDEENYFKDQIFRLKSSINYFFSENAKKALITVF